MDELTRFDIRIYTKSSEGIDREAFMGVFQRWIQRHAIPGVLIDVADYSHIHNGHGTILVAHEYNLSIDYADGKMALLLRVKRSAEATLTARIESALRLALKACRLLEKEEVIAGKLSFDPTAFEFAANDRLIAPNDDATFAATRAAIENAGKSVLGAAVATERVKGDSRERLRVRAASAKPIALAALSVG